METFRRPAPRSHQHPEQKRHGWMDRLSEPAAGRAAPTQMKTLYGRQATQTARRRFGKSVAATQRRLRMQHRASGGAVALCEAPISKTGEGLCPSGGSNPPLSATFFSVGATGGGLRGGLHAFFEGVVYYLEPEIELVGLVFRGCNNVPVVVYCLHSPRLLDR